MRRTQGKHMVDIGTEEKSIDIPIDEVLESFDLCDGDLYHCEKCVVEKYKLHRFSNDYSCVGVLMLALRNSVIHYRNMCQGQEIRVEKYREENKKLKKTLDHTSSKGE